nr:hypothetical protein [Demequina subtropica]
MTEFATRAYDSGSRVWVQADTRPGTATRASSMNRYAYVEGAPETYVDVMGAYRAAAAQVYANFGPTAYAVFVAELKRTAAEGVRVQEEQIAQLEAERAAMEAARTDCGDLSEMAYWLFSGGVSCDASQAQYYEFDPL